jgi:hypothetical protein
MTSEQKLDRLERIARLFIRAGLRMRVNLRELDEKIGVLVNYQIQNEERFARLEDKMNIMVDAQIGNEERFAKSDERFEKFEERLVKSDERFARFEVQTDRTFNALMEIMRELRIGNSPGRSTA